MQLSFPRRALFGILGEMSDIIAHIVAASTSIETKAVEEFEIFAKSQADAADNMILKKEDVEQRRLRTEQSSSRISLPKVKPGRAHCGDFGQGGR